MLGKNYQNDCDDNYEVVNVLKNLGCEGNGIEGMDKLFTRA